MMTKKRGTSETMAIEEDPIIAAVENTIEEPSTQTEENTEKQNLLAKVAEIRKFPNVTGYILRTNENATIDFEDPTKIVAYALLSSQAFESSETLASSFSLGDIQTIIIEGKTVKALLINLDEDRLSIFMDKNFDHTAILTGLISQQG